MYSYEEGVEAYITKDVLKKGFKHVIGTVFRDGTFVYIESDWSDVVVGNKHWHRTLEDAKVRANKMRLKKIKKLRKKLDELESGEF